MTAKLPLVSVATLIYNTQPEFVISAIESIRDQTYSNLEHIIIDDGSTRSESKDVVKQWLKDNSYECTYVELEVNQGLCKTLNYALSISKGEFFCACCDDIFLPNTIEDQVRFAEENNARVVVCRIETFGNVEKCEVLPSTEVVSKFNELSKRQQFEMMVNKNVIPAIGALTRMSIYSDVGNYDSDLRFEDYDFWLRVLRVEKIYFNDKVLARYRVHGTSLSATLTNWEFDLVKIYLKHFKLSSLAKRKVEKIAIEFYRVNNKEKLKSLFALKNKSLVLFLIYLFIKVRFPKFLGYRFLWRI